MTIHWFTLFNSGHDHKVIHPVSTSEIKLIKVKEILIIPLLVQPRAYAKTNKEKRERTAIAR